MSHRFIKYALIQLAVLALVAVAVVVQRGGLSSANASGGLNSVIVELRDDPAAIYKAKAAAQGRQISEDELQTYRNGLSAAQDKFLTALRSAGVAFEVEQLSVQDFAGQTAATVPYRFTLVYNGVTLKVPASEIARIESMPQVKKVHQNNAMRVALTRSVRYVNAPRAYGKVAELTPFDDLREGFEGQGINIAVLDTGIDWTHEMFGGDATPPRLGVAPPNGNTNKKVIYYLPTTPGFHDGFGHGTHSSADAAGYLGFAPGADGLPGTADDERVHGVAPQARLMGYKVCADVGSCLSASTILAIEDAVSPRTLNGLQKPVAHVINMSLGGAGGPDDATAVASDNATFMGTIVVASAGNSGPDEGTVGSPAAGRHVIAVGANTDPGTGVNTADLTDGSRTGMKAVLMDGAAAVTNDITNNYVYCGLAETPDQVPDSVRGRIALIARGSTVTSPELPVAGSVGTGLFQSKAYNAMAKGAVAAIIYNNVDGELSATTVRAATIPVLGMSKENGEYLKSIIGSSAAGAVSAKQLRINNELQFSPDMADFSSRGPVQGYGQIKPDVTAPGVNIMSATVRVGGPDTNTGTMFDPTGYIGASGTSFSGPHVAGAAALIKQAHLDWTPDMVRTALINTATNLREVNGTPKPDGAGADSIIAQGGGLMDVYGAISTKALMGVAGDGLNAPGILGSHSFGEVPVVNSRTTHTESVTVTLRDISGQDRTYNLQVIANRDLQHNGMSVTVSQPSITVPANGSATYTVNATIDGNILRSLPAPIQMQWFVTASSTDGAQRLRMPFYLKPVPSVPGGGSGGSSTTETYSGNVPVGDAGLQLADGVTYVDVSFPVSASTFRIDGRLDFSQVVDGVIHDLDFELHDPDGNVIDSSGNAGGPEFVSASVNRGGNYVYRVIGFANLSTDFTITSTQSGGGSGSEPPQLQAIAGEFVDSQNRQVDFDGQFTLNWQPRGGERSFEIERSSDGQNYDVIATAASNVVSLALSNQPEGTLSYRVRALYPGQIGSYVSAPSNAEQVTVSRRSLVDITSQVKAAIVSGSLSFTGGLTQFNQTLTSQAARDYFPHLRFNIVGISSTSGTVAVINADNSGDGKTEASAASFDYSRQLGSDDKFSPAEATGARTLRFRNDAAEMFSFTARVTGYDRAVGDAGNSENISSGGAPPSAGGSGSMLSTPSLLRFTVNPLTKVVQVQLVKLP